MNNIDTYEKWKKYIGCGNPDARIWIIGIEEGGNFTEDETPEQFFFNKPKKDFKEYLNAFHQHNEENTFKNESSPVWLGALKILREVLVDLVIEDYRLISPKSDVFLANIYPLGKSSVKNWPYEDVIGTHKDYLTEMETSRSKLFPNLIENKIVIFHGKGSWSKAYEILGIDENEFKPRNCSEKYKDGWLFVNEKRKMIFTRHFARGMPDALLTKIGQIVSQWHSEL